VVTNLYHKAAADALLYAADRPVEPFTLLCGNPHRDDCTVEGDLSIYPHSAEPPRKSGALCGYVGKSPPK